MVKHLIDIDQQTGFEYRMEDLDGYVSDPAYFFERAAEVMKPIKYSQIEFRELPTTLCTWYGSLNALASRVGKNFSESERREFIKLRMAEKDYSAELGGFTSIWVDVARRWWNTHNPENPIVTFAIDVSSELGKKFFAKNFPVVTSVRGNTAYQKDNRDGTLDATSWGKTTFWHCRMRIGMTFHDNYIVSKVWREYKYPSIENYLEASKKWYERPIIYAFFLEKELSWDGKKLVDAMKAKLWNWERENDNLTRFEAFSIANRIGQWKVAELDIWNGKNPDQDVSKFEFFTMLSRVNSKFTPYLWTDRNKMITRKQAILSL